jgi:hypothetical protein
MKEQKTKAENVILRLKSPEDKKRERERGMTTSYELPTRAYTMKVEGL